MISSLLKSKVAQLAKSIDEVNPETKETILKGEMLDPIFSR